jgi:hypothetical protein
MVCLRFFLRDVSQFQRRDQTLSDNDFYVIRPGAIQPTTALIPVYLPTGDGTERIVVGKASVDENGMAMIVIDNRTEGRYLGEKMLDGTIVSVSFEQVAAKPAYPELSNMWGHGESKKEKTVDNQ